MLILTFSVIKLLLRASSVLKQTTSAHKIVYRGDGHPDREKKKQRDKEQNSGMNTPQKVSTGEGETPELITTNGKTQ